MPCTVFIKFAEFVPRLGGIWVALAVEISLDLLKGLWSHEGFKLMRSVTAKFSAPPSDETVCQTPKSFKGARTCSRSSALLTVSS